MKPCKYNSRHRCESYTNDPHFQRTVPSLSVIDTTWNKLVWKDGGHYFRFWLAYSVLYPHCQASNAFIAALFLLTADAKLLLQALGQIYRNRIAFRAICIRSVTPTSYALFKAAKSLYCKSSEVGIDEVADPMLLDAETFRLIMTAMSICRYGLIVLCRK